MTQSMRPFDPRDPQFRANPYPTFDHLRTHDPIHYRKAQGDWILTRYADVSVVLQDARFGHSTRATQRALDVPADQIGPPLKRYQESSEALLRLWILLLNPPDHTRIRQLFQPYFIPRRISELNRLIQSIVDECIEKATPAGQMDVIGDLGFPLPIIVISEILGIPEAERHPAFREWSMEMSLGLDFEVTPIAHLRGMLAFARFVEYFTDLIDRWDGIAGGEDTLLGTMIQAWQSKMLSREELLANCILLFFAGHTTIQHLIGNGILALLHHPTELARLRADPSLLPGAISETLRYNGPLQHVWRTALTRVDIGDRKIQEGEQVNLLLGAAHRDPARFMHPDRFDIGRAPERLLAFGRGIHYCLGSHVAPAAAQIAIGALVQRLPELRLSSDPLEWEETFLVRGLKQLRVEFSPPHATQG